MSSFHVTGRGDESARGFSQPPKTGSRSVFAGQIDAELRHGFRAGIHMQLFVDAFNIGSPVFSLILS